MFNWCATFVGLCSLTEYLHLMFTGNWIFSWCHCLYCKGKLILVSHIPLESNLSYSSGMMCAILSNSCCIATTLAQWSVSHLSFEKLPQHKNLFLFFEKSLLTCQRSKRQKVPFEVQYGCCYSVGICTCGFVFGTSLLIALPETFHLYKHPTTCDGYIPLRVLSLWTCAEFIFSLKHVFPLPVKHLYVAFCNQTCVFLILCNSCNSVALALYN